jgi:hypothetical protein
MSGKACHNSIRMIFIAAILQCTGCSGGDLPATEEAARAALASALDAWKAGQKAEDMRGQDAEVIVRDTDWKLGRRLAGYEIGHGEFDGKTLRIPVTLTLALPPRGNRRFVVNYIVGTQPVVTIFRDGE